MCWHFANGGIWMVDYKIQWIATTLWKVGGDYLHHLTLTSWKMMLHEKVRWDPVQQQLQNLTGNWKRVGRGPGQQVYIYQPFHNTIHVHTRRCFGEWRLPFKAKKARTIAHQPGWAQYQMKTFHWFTCETPYLARHITPMQEMHGEFPQVDVSWYH